MARERPSGTVTFLFTDIEGSTRLWEEHAHHMRVALERHDAIVRSAIENCGGYVFATGGDGFAAAFDSAPAAVSAAANAQAELASTLWPEATPVGVRMGLHTGTADERAGDYFGPAVNRAARIMAAGHGGQVLVSSATAALLPADTDLLDLGSHRLKDLGVPEGLFQAGSGAFAPLRTLENTPHNLPVRRGELLGRDDDIDRALDALSRSRLVTLTGMGGTGKTSLALACAAELIDTFADGVWFVDLVPVTTTERLPIAVAEAMGLLLSSGTVEELGHLLDGRASLIVLDNCEHVIDDVADLVDVLLGVNDPPTLLATSREPIELLDERVIAVPPLATSEAGSSPATDLFVARAERVGAVVAERELSAVASICDRLDGLPLAIELAAGQLAHMTVRELEDRLDQRFELLTAAGRGRRQQRHASLDAVLTETWGHLPEAEQRLLKMLAVFPGSFDLQAVEGLTAGAATAVPAVALRGLVQKALVAATTDGDDSTYRLLETVKLFAQRATTDDDTAEYRDRHLGWLLSHIDAVDLEDQYTLLPFVDWYHRYYEDLRAATDHAVATGRLDDAVRIVAAGGAAWYQFADTRCVDGLVRIDELLTHDALPSLSRARLRLAGALASMGARQAHRLATDAALAVGDAEDAGDPTVLARAITVASWSTGLRDPDTALSMIDRAEQIALETGLTEIARDAGAYRPVPLALSGRWDEAVDALEHELTMHYAEDRVACTTLFGLGHAIALFDRPDLAASLLEAALRTVRAQNRPLPWNHYVSQALQHTLGGQYPAAARDLETAQQRARRTGTDDGLPDLLVPIALAAHAAGDRDRCRRLLGAVRAAPRPTQNFGPTLVYHQLRRKVGLPPPEEMDGDTTSVYADAREWLIAADRETGSGA